MLLDGGPGTPQLFAGPTCDLWGADGQAFDSKDNMYVAVNIQGKIVRVDSNGNAQTTAAASNGDPLFFPSAIAFGNRSSDREQIFITNFAAPAGTPGIAKMDVGVPGRRLARLRPERSGVFYFAQAGGGGGFLTEITLTNPSSAKSISGAVSFFAPDGRPLTGVVDNPEVPFSIPASGTVTISTKTQGPIQSGYARVLSPDAVIATAVLTLPLLPSLVVEPTAPTAFVYQAAINRNLASGTEVGVAIVNVSDRALRVILNLVGSSGGKTVVFLGPGEQLSRTFAELFPGLPQKFEGILRVAGISPLPSQSIVTTVVQFGPGVFKAAPLTVLNKTGASEEEDSR